MRRYVIKKADVHKTARTAITVQCSHCKHVVFEYPFEPLGLVMPQDVGKICVKVGDDVWQVENDAQMRKRIGGKT